MLNVDYKIVQKRRTSRCKQIILPGVGAFDDAMNKFNNSGLRRK